MDLKRGDIVTCASNGDYGKPRPAVIIQSDLFNKTHASITVCPVTSHLVEAPLFRPLLSPNKANGLKQASQIMVDKMVSLPREKIHKKLGALNQEQQNHLEQAIQLWLSLNGPSN